MKRASYLVLPLWLAAGCRAQPPFDAANDCPEIAYCGQCASRGGCAWCGAQDESGKGRCVAVGRADCAAPEAWSKAPDRCPLPPAEAGSPVAPRATAQASPSPVQKAIGPEKYALIRSTLVRAFPHATVTDETVVIVARRQK